LLTDKKKFDNIIRKKIAKIVQYLKQQQSIKELTAGLIKKAKITINRELIKQ